MKPQKSVKLENLKNNETFETYSGVKFQMKISKKRKKNNKIVEIKQVLRIDNNQILDYQNFLNMNLFK